VTTVGYVNGKKKQIVQAAKIVKVSLFGENVQLQSAQLIKDIIIVDIVLICPARDCKRPLIMKSMEIMVNG